MVDQNNFHVDAELKPFYDSFMKKAKESGATFVRPEYGLSVGVGNLEYPHQGLTNYDIRSVVINKNLIKSNLGHYYNNHVDSMEVQYTVYHELAHYFLNREHLPDSTYTIMTAHSSYLLKYMRNPIDESRLNDELFRN